MHKLMWNRMEFPIQQTREECFRNQNSLLPVFLLQHKYHVHTVCLLPGRQRRDPEFWPFDGQAWWKETAATAWEICYGKSASQLCPSNHQINMWLIIWWGSCNHQASFSFLFWDFVVELSPSHRRSVSEGRNKNAACPFCVVHVQFLTDFYQNEAILFQWKLSCEEKIGFGVEDKGMLHLSPDLLGLWPSAAWLTEGVLTTARAGECWHTPPSFLPGSSNEDECLGIFFSSTV